MRTEDKKDKDSRNSFVKSRPLWQRLVYPFVGVVLILLGIILWLTPIVMGFPLIFMGIPFLFCMHPRLEQWGRRKVNAIRRIIKKKRRRGKPG